MKLLVGLIAVLTSIPSIAAIEPFRTFPSRMNVTTASAPHVVHFNGQTKELVICANGEISLCRSFEVEATDVLPAFIDGQSRIVLANGNKPLKSCSMGVSALKCDPLDVTTLTGGKLSLTSHNPVILEGGRNCAWSSESGLRCSSVEPMAERDSTLLFGRFTGASQIQVLSLGARKICDVGGGCRSAQGLDLLTSAKNIATIGKYSKNFRRASLFGTGEGLETACVAFFQSKFVVGFSCSQQISQVPAGIAAHTLGGGQLIYAPVKKNWVELASMQTNAARNTARAQPQRARQLTRDAFKYAGTLRLGSATSWRDYGDNIDEWAAVIEDVGEWKFRKTQIYYDDEDGDDHYYDVSNIYVEGFGNWYSDMFDVWYQISTQQRTRAQCMESCDMYKRIDEAHFGLLQGYIGLIGIAATTTATVAAAITGPFGVLATAAGGLGLTAGAVLAVQSWGLAKVNERLIQCWADATANCN